MNITGPIFDLAGTSPESEAILALDGGLTYAELARAVDSTAARLRREGLAPGDVAAICVANQLQLLVSSLALARMGAGQIIFQASDPPALLEAVARRLRLAAVIALRNSSIPAGIAGLEPPPAGVVELRALAPAAPLAVQGGASAYACNRTSGSTGAPRLMLLDHARALKRLAAFGGAAPHGPGVRHLSFTNLGFPGALRSAMRCLTSGGALATLDGINSASAAVAFIERLRINNLSGSPVHAARLLAVAREGTLLLPGLQVFRLSSTLVPDALRAEVMARITPNLFILYGTTEGGAVTVAPPELVRRVPGVVGFPLEGVEVRIIDDAGRPVAQGRRGEVCVRSEGMSTAYLEDDVETARRFRDGWFHTGDVAEWTAEGALVHHGRADDTMVFQGINVLPGEIEACLLDHPAVAEAAAYPVKSAVAGDLPLAAVVLKAAATDAELLAHCRRQLGARSPVALRILAQLPRNAAGKVLRTELARLESQAGAMPRTPSPPPRSTG